MIKKLRARYRARLNGMRDIALFWKLRGQYASRRGLFQLLALRKYLRLNHRYGAYIPINAALGRNVSFPHAFYGIFISTGAEIGDGCTVFQHVTVGSNTLRDSAGFGAPRVGKNAVLGAGAKVIGNVSVGDGARIGANCVVTRDVPKNATVVLAAPRVIEHEEKRNNTFRAIDEV